MLINIITLLILLFIFLFIFKNYNKGLIENPVFIFLLVHLTMMSLNIILRLMKLYIVKYSFSSKAILLYIIGFSIVVAFFEFGKRLFPQNNNRHIIVIRKSKPIKFWLFSFCFLSLIGTMKMIIFALDETGATDLLDLYFTYYWYLDQGFLLSGYAYLWHLNYVNIILGLILLNNKKSDIFIFLVILISIVSIILKADYLYIIFMLMIIFYLINTFNNKSYLLGLIIIFSMFTTIKMNYPEISFMQKIAPYTYINYDSFSYLISKQPLKFLNLNLHNISDLLGPFAVIYNKIIENLPKIQVDNPFPAIGKVFSNGSYHYVKTNIETLLGTTLKLGLIPGLINIAIFSTISGFVYSNRYKNLYLYILNIGFCLVFIVSIGGWIVSLPIIYLPIIYLLIINKVILKNIHFRRA